MGVPLTSAAVASLRPSHGRSKTGSLLLATCSQHGTAVPHASGSVTAKTLTLSVAEIRVGAARTCAGDQGQQ